MVLTEKLEFCCFHKSSSNLPLVTSPHDASFESGESLTCFPLETTTSSFGFL